MTTIATQCMTEREATQLTEKIRLTAHNYADARSKLQRYVAEAKEGNAHLALGYASWTAYLSEVLGEEPMRLARGERQEMVQMLSAEGMSTRAIAPIVGASQMQVVRDVRAGETNVSPEPVISNDPGKIVRPTGPNSAATVTGMDGRSYTRPEPAPDPTEPSKPKRPPLPEQFFNATYDLGKNVERLQRLVEDDRFPQNREKVAAKHRHDLQRTADVLADILRSMN